jgi:hypothetical protein
MQHLNGGHSLILGYHGCDATLARRLIMNERDELGQTVHLRESQEHHDWLGTGVYFWVDSPELAMGWAKMRARDPNSPVKQPAVVGALIRPGNLLNITTRDAHLELRKAFLIEQEIAHAYGIALPENEKDEDGEVRLRNRDRHIIEVVHQLREDKNREALDDGSLNPERGCYPPYDTVFGVYESGSAIFPGSSLRAHSHIQIAVRASHNKHSNILAYFGVRGFTPCL